MTTTRFTDQLNSSLGKQIIALSQSCSFADGVRPLNEAALLALEAPNAQHALLTGEDELIGYAQFDGRDVQLFVSPERRGTGLGRQLAKDIVTAWQPAGWWSFGTLPAAQKLAAELDLHPVRELAKMERALADASSSPKIGDYQILPYQDQDLPALIEVNGRAFADHPEQGQMDAADALRRMSQDWFDPDDLLLLKTPDGQLAGFHWTKLEADLGEVYVLAVDPKFAGQGLGRKLLNAGLAHLQQRGANRVELYVEKNNGPVVRLYQTAGFEITKIDTNYAPASASADAPNSDSNE